MPRRVALGLVALAALGLVVRWTWTLGVDPEVPEIGDASAYHLLAEGIAGGDGYVRPFDRVLFDEHRATAEYPPLHPAVIAVADVVGIDGVTGQRLWLSLFGAASVGVTGLLAWRLSGRADATYLAGAVAALHPLWFQADATLMPETLAALLGGAAVAVAIDAVRSPAKWTLVALGAICALAGLTRSEALLLVPFVAVPAAYAARRSWRDALVPVVAAAVVLAPWAIRNAMRFDEVVPVSTNLGSVLDGANCDATYNGSLLGYWQFTTSGTECFEGFTQRELAFLDDESVVADEHRHAGWHYAVGHVEDWPQVALARLGRTVALFRPGQLTDLGALEGREQGADWVGYVLVWASLGLAVVGCVSLRRAGKPWWVPASAVAVIWGSTALTYGNPRFLAVAQPSLVALAACGAMSFRRPTA